MLRSSKALGTALAAVLLASPVLAQVEAPAEEPHDWIVLLDVSHSFSDLDKKQSKDLAVNNYKLRNELMSLLQTVLATLQAEQKERRDHLAVYLFGKGVKRVTELSPDAIRWSGVQDETWWDQQIQADNDLRSRTDLFEALRMAKEHFEASAIDGKKHLILISDGELDYGTVNRLPGGPMRPDEEVKRYLNLLSPKAPIMAWLSDNKVSVLTLAIDEGLAGPHDVERQKAIQRRLYGFRYEGETPLDWARALVKDLDDRTKTTGKLPYSEGPYVMRALAKAFGGQSRSVRYDNALDILWKSLLPGRNYKRVRLFPDTRELIVMAPRESPVPLTVQDEHGTKHRLTLTLDADSYPSVSPPGVIADSLSVQRKLTSQYVTWVVLSPYRIIEVEADSSAEELQQRINAVPISPVKLIWRENEPPGELLGDTTAELTLELVLKPSTPWDPEMEPEARWSQEDWRQTLRDVELRATARVSRPDLATREIDLVARVPDELSPVVLELSGTFVETEVLGTYDVDAELVIAEEPYDSPMKAPPISFIVRGKPSPVSLFLRQLRGGAPGAPIAIEAPSAGAASIIQLDADASPEAVFEWRADAGVCDRLDELRVEVSDPPEALGPESNTLDEGETLAEDDATICYRSSPVALGLVLGGDPITVIGHNGALKVQRSFRIPLPPPPPPWWLAGCVYPFLAVLACLAVLAAIPSVRKKAKRRYKTGKAIGEAKFPLAAKLDSGHVEWRDGTPKRLLIVADESGQLRAEFARRAPASGEEAVELRPVSRQSYRLRALSGTDWSFRMIKEGARSAPAFSPLGSEGETLYYMDLVDDARFEVRHDESTVTLGHKTYL